MTDRRRRELGTLFRRETNERLEVIESALERASRSPMEDLARLQAQAHEAAHSLRGIAAMAGVTDVAELSADLERMLEGDTVAPAVVPALAELAAAIRARLDGASVAVRPSEAPADGGPLVLLHVDDDATSRRLVQIIVGAAGGITLLSAPDGKRALELARSARPGLVLLDLHLAGEDGEALLRRLRDTPTTSDARIVVMSAESDPGVAERLVAAGADGFVTKPVEPEALLDLLRA